MSERQCPRCEETSRTVAYHTRTPGPTRLICVQCMMRERREFSGPSGCLPRNWWGTKLRMPPKYLQTLYDPP